jgi:rhodanese-related sulfurtransferase
MSSYAGDISVEEAWGILQDNPSAVLVDVRTQAEWAFVGTPDLASLNKAPVLIEWQSFPTMALNPSFTDQLIEQLESVGVSPDDPIMFLCRSGQRSRSSAVALTEKGYSACHNVAGGFEGDLASDRHRGQTNGWKVADLPWTQS